MSTQTASAPAAGPRPNSVAARAVAHYFQPYHNLKANEAGGGPMVISRGNGVWVYDDAGKAYIEGMAGLWCTGLGFSEPRLADAAAAQMRTLPYYHAFSGKVQEISVDLAERLVTLAGCGMSKALFANSGSEAVDTAIKLVWYYNNGLGRPHRKKIIARRRAYHGITLAAASVTGLPYARDGFDVPINDRFLHTETPHHYRFGHPGESEEEFASRLAGQLEALIEREGPDTIAAFIAEPIIGAGGVLIPPRTYFEKVQAVLRKHDILFVADEVICGFYRTGQPFGSHTFGIQPDIMTMAKQLTSGYIPMSATLVSDKVFGPVRDYSDQLGMFGHGYTYTGHPVAAAVALETLRLYEEYGTMAHVQALAPVFGRHLQGLADHPLVGHARSKGLIGAIDIVKDKATREMFPAADAVAKKVAAKAQDHGLIVRPLPGDIVAFCPPMIIAEDEMAEMFRRVAAALDDVAKAVGAV